MENNSVLPVLIEGNEDIQVYEKDGELCMSAENIGKCFGFSDPSKAMDQIYQRNKEELEEWRFSPQIEGKSPMGRPPIFYYEEGIYIAAFLAKTEVAKNFRRKVARLLKQIRQRQRFEWNQKYVLLLEKHAQFMEKKLKKRIPLSKEERQRIFDLYNQGVSKSEIARILERSRASVINIIRYGNTSGLIKMADK